MSALTIPHGLSQAEAIEQGKKYLVDLGVETVEIDDSRPWGGFFVIANESTELFINLFFPDLDRDEIYKYGDMLCPKLLLIKPNQKLSWQYHNRRAELWKVIVGPVGVMVSETDEQPLHHDVLQTGEIVAHADQVRHRLIGLNNWGAVAEIWQHTDSSQASTEEDIIRLEDSYNRN